jgi:hypothetical protein
MTMPVYVIVPTNDRGKSVSRITVRTTPVTNLGLSPEISRANDLK